MAVHSLQKHLAVPPGLDDERLGHPVRLFFEYPVYNDEGLETKEIEEPHLVAGKFYPELVDAVFQEVRVGPGQRGSHLFQQFEEPQNLHLVLGPARVQEFREWAGREKGITEKDVPFFLHNLTPSNVSLVYGEEMLLSTRIFRG